MVRLLSHKNWDIPSVCLKGLCGWLTCYRIIIVVQSLRRVDSSWPLGLCSTPGFPVLCHLLELAQTHVHWVRDAIHPLSNRKLIKPTPEGFVKTSSSIKENRISHFWVSGDFWKRKEREKRGKWWNILAGFWLQIFYLVEEHSRGWENKEKSCVGTREPVLWRKLRIKKKKKKERKGSEMHLNKPREEI